MSTLKEDIKQAFDGLFANITWNIDDIQLFDNPFWYPIYPQRFIFDARPKKGYKNEKKCFDILRKHVQSQKKEDVLLVFDLEELMCNLLNVNKLLKKCVDQIKKELSIKKGLTSDFILINKNNGIFLIDSKGDESDKNEKKATKQGKVFQSIMMNYIDGLDETYFEILPYYTTNKQDEEFHKSFIEKLNINKREKPMSDEIFDKCVKFLLRLKYNEEKESNQIIKKDNEKHSTALEKYVSICAELKAIASTDLKKRIIAGPAGCGKTQVIKYKVANLIKSKAAKQELTLIVVSSQTEKMYSYINGLSFKGDLKHYFYFYINKLNLRNFRNTFKRLDFKKITSLEIFISSKDKMNCFIKIICNDICYLSDYSTRNENEVTQYDDISSFITFFELDIEFCFENVNVVIYHDYDYQTNSDLCKFLDFFEKICSHWKTRTIQKIHEPNLDLKLLELFKFSVILIEPNAVDIFLGFSTGSLFSILTKSTIYCNNEVDILIDDFQAYGFVENGGFQEIDEEKVKKIDHLWITLDLYQLMKKMNSTSLKKHMMFDFGKEEFSITFMDKVLRCSKKIFDIIEPIYQYRSMKQKHEDENLMNKECSFKSRFNCFKCFWDYVKVQKEAINARNAQKKTRNKIQLNTTYNDFIKYYTDFELDIKCGYDYEADGEVRVFPIEYSESESESNIVDKLIEKVRDTIEMLIELFYDKNIAVYIDSYYPMFSFNFLENDVLIDETKYRERNLLEWLNKLKQQDPRFRNIHILTVDDWQKEKEFSAEYDAVIYVAPGLLNDFDINDYRNLNEIVATKSNPYLFISRAIHDLTIIYVRCNNHNPPITI